MSETKPRSPGPLWVWFLIAMAATFAVKTAIFASDPPARADFKLGERFIQNAGIYLAVGVGVCGVWVLVRAVMNRGAR